MTCEYCNVDHGTKPCAACGGPVKSAPWWKRLLTRRDDGYLRTRSEIARKIKQLDAAAYKSPYSSARESLNLQAHTLRWVIDSEVSL